MANPNRAALLTKTHKVLKKHYKPVVHAERPILEQLLFAACAENAHYDKAEQAYQALVDRFFDWNEVRVSTTRELAEVMSMLPDPEAVATNIRKLLYGVFESTYSFEIEALKKQNLGQAIQRLKKFGGASEFMIGFATQNGLGGHAVPVDRGALESLRIIGVINDAEVAEQTVPGMERAIPKSKGVEFGSLLHQLGADLVASPYAPAVHKILLEIAPEAKDRLPKRQSKAAKISAAEEAKERAKAARSAKESKDKEHKEHEAKGKPALEKGKPVLEKKKPPVLEKAEERKVEAEKRPARKPEHEAKKPDHDAKKSEKEKNLLPKKKGALPVGKRKPR
jgi:hypothetical protein